MNSTRRDIVLVGGGHSHVAVLADWARKGCPARHATLITPEPILRYSGMVPGWISGEHGREDGLVDLSKLAKAAGIDLVLDRCVAMDPNARSVLTQENGLIGFEYASIDVGGVGQAARILGDDPLLIDVRPIGAFVDRMAGELAQARVRPLNIVVIGGGAGGAELAFALRNAHGNTQHIQNPPNVSFVLGEGGLLPGFAPRVIRLVKDELAHQGIETITGDARIKAGKVMVAQQVLEPDLIIAAIGSGAPDWSWMRPAILLLMPISVPHRTAIFLQRAIVRKEWTGMCRIRVFMRCIQGRFWRPICVHCCILARCVKAIAHARPACI